MAAKTQDHDFYYIFSSDEFELKFPKLSWAELKKFQAEPNQAGDMYVDKKILAQNFFFGFIKF